MSLWLRVFLFGLWLLPKTTIGSEAPPIYELGFEEQRILIQQIEYLIEPASKPLDLGRLKDARDWKTSAGRVFFRPWEIKDKRVIFSFMLFSTVDLIYLKYNWATPLRFQKFVILDALGHELTSKVEQEEMLLTRFRAPPNQYRVYFIAEPAFLSYLSSDLLVMNAAYMVSVQSKATKITMLIYGIGLAFTFFNFAMYLLIRRSYFIYYVCYSLSFLTILAIANGDLPQVNFLVWNSCLNLNCLFTILMSSAVLRLRQYHPQLLRATLILWGISLVFMTTFYFFESDLPWMIGTALGIMCYMLCMYAAVRRMMSGYIPATFFALGWGVLAVGFGLNFLSLHIVNAPGLGWSAYIAYAVESVLFAVALAYRTRDSEQRAINDKDHALSQLEKVFYPHQINLIKGGAQLEETMPTMQGHACVLSFEIVGSAHIKHIKAKSFFRNMLMRCNALMSEGYDGKKLKANAYRVKETEDGFVCSVGYPFESLSGNSATDTFELAKKFAQALVEESAFLHLDKPLTCGIGIALDAITGFYPEAGAKEYHIHGPAVTLATRYGGMRKHLFGADETRSILIIQELVYLSLEPQHRDQFITVDLRERGMIVRDDPAASHLYYLFLDPFPA